MDVESFGDDFVADADVVNYSILGGVVEGAMVQADLLCGCICFILGGAEGV